MKKSLVALVASATAVGALAVSATLLSSGALAQAVTLRLFSYMGASDQAQWAPLLKEFTAANPGINVNIEILPGTGAATYPDVLRTGMASGDPPDLFWMWGGTVALPFVKAGQTADLTPYYQKYGWNKTLAPWSVARGQLNGKQFGVPRAAQGMGFFYRKDILAKYNLKPPTSVKSFEALCGALIKNGINCVSIGGKYGWHTMRVLDYFLEVNCGPTKHDQLNLLEVSWTDKCVVDSYTTLKKWIDNKWITPDFLGVAPDDARPAVYRGTAAMILEGAWFESALKNDGQDVSKFDFLVPPTGHTPVRFSTFPEFLMISKASKHQDEAAKFIDYVSNAAVQRKYPDLFSTQSATVGVNPNCTEFPITCKIRNFVAASKNTYPPTDQAFEKELMDTFFAVQDGIVAGKNSPEQGAQMMQSAAEKWKSSKK
jgi:raffinose/stachyose/melibiose transport system substrate-binding protein